MLKLNFEPSQDGNNDPKHQVIPSSVTMKQVDILKKGLKNLQDQISDQKWQLKADLKANRPISEADEEWLDNAGNLVDHELVVQELEMASDYEAAYEALDLQHKSIVQKLQKLAMSGEKSVVPSKKRKCMDLKV